MTEKMGESWETQGKQEGTQEDWDGRREPRMYTGDRKGLGLDGHAQEMYGVTWTWRLHQWEHEGGRTRD